jgi:hypothetical protein
MVLELDEDTMTPNSLEQLRIAIEKTGKSSFHVAQDFGMAQSFVYKALSGREPISPRFAFEAERLYGIPAISLMKYQAELDYRRYCERRAKA